MTYKSHHVAILASAGSLSLLSGAWIFQALGYAPCAMCIWQRYPHAIAILLGLVVLFGLRHIGIYLLGAAAAATTAGLGLYHSGVERGWWEGPSTCTGSGFDMLGLSGQQLLSTSGPSNVVMCDEVVWEFLSLSMASWNAIFSLMIAVFWVIAAVLAYRSRASV
ncbi:disulfide bond formation protein B [Loktanella sp. 3ANDIMAR09]|uniref:disulfide bond formation protein B n=1 Tax=Loktanella sp. 3ANDIMAR09 TaxID=1225657 RepID=UPI0009F8AEF7|nr:disulfide bond formation protein B [Loktanella sp. 3ANDIMAR09]